MRRLPFACATALTAYDACVCALPGSLADSRLCGVAEYGNGTYTAEGIDALCDALKGNNTLTSLKYASQLESLPAVYSP